jgi:D-aminoacyl-tRNA deacylase
MRAVVQRVSSATVSIEGRTFAEIRQGLLVFLGIEERDHSEDVEFLSSKICQMRIFSDKEGKMNLDVNQVNGELLIISQFTLHASTKKGNRPSFTRAARPETAVPLYESVVARCHDFMRGRCKTGVFGADMKVNLINDGPVTILIDSKDKE